MMIKNREFFTVLPDDCDRTLLCIPEYLALFGLTIQIDGDIAHIQQNGETMSSFGAEALKDEYCPFDLVSDAIFLEYIDKMIGRDLKETLYLGHNIISDLQDTPFVGWARYLFDAGEQDAANHFVPIIQARSGHFRPTTEEDLERFHVAQIKDSEEDPIR